MSIIEQMTEHEEHLLAKEIVKLLLQKGVSCGQAFRILKDAKAELKKLPIVKKKAYCGEPEEQEILR